jgi:pyridoxamine 5'-phosphate oxidase
MTIKYSDPFQLFQQWLEAAKAHPQIEEPTAMTLATSAENIPSARIVLLKGIDERGFVFYSNARSEKGQALAHNPYASLCFYWMPLERQVRISGAVQQVDAVEADAYFASRSREKQLGAWASQQSRVMTERAEFEARLQEMEQRFAGQDVPRPPYWTGWRVVPQHIEFWQQQAHRWHHRTLYVRSGEGWEVSLLYP